MKTLTVKLDEIASVNLEAIQELLGEKTGAGAIRNMILTYKALTLENRRLQAENDSLEYENQELKKSWIYERSEQ